MLDYVWERPEWPGLYWDSARLLPALAECRKRQGRLLAIAEGLGFEAGRKAQADNLVREAVTTAEIEGVRLEPDAVRSSVARRLGLPDAGLPEPDRTVEGLVEVLFDATGRIEAPLSAERLFAWHAALFPTGYSGLRRITVAAWRETPMRILSGPVGKERIHFEAPPKERVPLEMDAFLDWWNESEETTDGLIRAGLAHFHFVTVHPFEDGNGRIARALTDMAMAQDEQSPLRCYSLSAQMRNERKDYYQALETAQKDSCDVTGWLLWFLGCFSRALDTSMQSITKAAQAGRFWQRFADAPFNARQHKVLKRLIEAGDDFTGGLSNRKYRSMTRTSQATAARDLAELVERGALRRTGAGRSVRYELALD